MSHLVKADAILLSAADNVATVLRAVAAGEQIAIRQGERTCVLVASEAVPLCHKISLAPIITGAAVTKYGESIGAASRPIAAGAHVHVHNMVSLRARRA